MLAKRILVSVVLLPVGLAFIYWGGPAYAVFMGLVLGLAAWEYTNLFELGGLHPLGWWMIAAVVVLTLSRWLTGFDHAPLLISLILLGSMALSLVGYERGHDQAGTDFAVTVAGALYLGWIGAYLISLRSLPEGLWWVLLALPSVWAADSGAYFAGRRFGRHLLSPRLSPKKTWEGYLGGVLAGTLAGGGLAAAYAASFGLSTVNLGRGALLGFTLAVLTTLGDLGESMFKRQVGAKDSGKLLPGHGGVFDRIDSWLWAGVIAYYLVVGFFIP